MRKAALGWVACKIYAYFLYVQIAYLIIIITSRIVARSDLYYADDHIKY